MAEPATVRLIVCCTRHQYLFADPGLPLKPEQMNNGNDKSSVGSNCCLWAIWFIPLQELWPVASTNQRPRGVSVIRQWPKERLNLHQTPFYFSHLFEGSKGEGEAREEKGNKRGPLTAAPWHWRIFCSTWHVYEFVLKRCTQSPIIRLSGYNCVSARPFLNSLTHQRQMGDFWKCSVIVICWRDPGVRRSGVVVVGGGVLKLLASTFYRSPPLLFTLGKKTNKERGRSKLTADWNNKWMGQKELINWFWIGTGSRHIMIQNNTTLLWPHILHKNKAKGAF